MKLITQISRLLVGLLFIFSGLIKLNDPMGFSFKLGDYFAADVLNLPFLLDYTLPIALFVVVLEVLLGVALLLGLWKNLTAWLLLLMIVFFTFLTFYSAYFNKVTDCGCFGDAIPLTPWESFGKDVVLTVLIAIIFFQRQLIQPLLKPMGSYITLALSFFLCFWLGHQVLNHLPLKDFRAYAEGKSIIEGMKSAEELGFEPTQYATIYTLENAASGESMKIDSRRYIDEGWWEKKEWQINSDLTETALETEGYEPPIHDFVIDLAGNEITDQVLEADLIFLSIAYRMEKTEDEAYAKLNEFALAAADKGIPFLGLSASLPSVVAEKTEKLGLRFSIASMDETALKTIVRANPGIVLLKKGLIVKKWHYQDLPDFAELEGELF
ncbi:MAG: DoxX family protein [Bacteroidetes bacterium]|nr:MAG: DoxX family protein [Bacteroidota bacterium]